MSIRLRAAEARDIESLLPLVQEFVTSFEVDEHRFRVSFSSILEQAGSMLWVAEDGALLVGYCLGFCHDTLYANGKVGWVEEIMVAASHRRAGVGEALMAAFEEWTKGQGGMLSALATRRAAAFYKALNYEESATYFRKLL